MRNLDIIDTRSKLGLYSAAGLMQVGPDIALPQIKQD